MSVAKVKVDTLHYTRVIVIRNICRTQMPNNPVCGVKICAAAVTRAQAWMNTVTELLMANDVTPQISINEEDVSRLVIVFCVSSYN